MIPSQSGVTSAPASGIGERKVRSVEPDEDDPQKGKWGGTNSANGRLLTAKVTPEPDDEDWFRVSLRVESMDLDNPLKGRVTFHLHDSFPEPDIDVKVKKGVASTSFLAYGAFTVGAEAEKGETKLELDLATLKDAPKEFRLG